MCPLPLCKRPCQHGTEPREALRGQLFACFPSGPKGHSMLAEYGIPHLFAWLIAAVHGLGVVAAIHAVLTVRTAQGALAWGLSLFFLPYLTLLPYLVFGRSRFDAYVKARRQANTEMHHAIAAQDWRPWVEEAKAAQNAPAYQQLLALQRLSRLPCLAGNRVQLLIDGEA